MTFSDFTDLNSNGSYVSKIAKGLSCELKAIDRGIVFSGISKRRVVRATLSSRYTVVHHTATSNQVSEAGKESFYGRAMMCTLISRKKSVTQSDIGLTGLLLITIADELSLDKLFLSYKEGRVGTIAPLLRRGTHCLARYEISFSRDALSTLPIHNKIKLCYEDELGACGHVSVKYNFIDLNRSTGRVAYVDFDHETYTTSYYRQAAHNTLCFSTRNSVSIDASREKRKIVLAHVVSRVFPVMRNTIVLYEKESSRYQESASVVYERLLDEGIQNAYFILDSSSPDYAKVPPQYRSNIVPKNSFKHYCLFFSAKTFIGSEMLAHAIDLRPANKIVTQRLNSKTINYVFLQHGVMFMLSLDSSSRDFFKPKKLKGKYRVVVSSELEKAHFVERGEYSPSSLYVCGLPKFDRNTWNADASKIVIMPTWRPWEYNAARIDFRTTGYYQLIVRMFNCIPEHLRDQVVILPHPLFLDFTKGAEFPLKHYFIGEDVEYGIILQDTKLLITDYSSIAYDAFYRGANVIFYWGELDYCMENYGGNSELMLTEDLAFGDVCYSEDELRSCLVSNYEGSQSESHLENYQAIVQFHDGHNVDRLIAMMREDEIV